MIKTEDICAIDRDSRVLVGTTKMKVLLPLALLVTLGSLPEKGGVAAVVVRHKKKASAGALTRKGGPVDPPADNKPFVENMHKTKAPSACVVNEGKNADGVNIDGGGEEKRADGYFRKLEDCLAFCAAIDECQVAVYVTEKDTIAAASDGHNCRIKKFNDGQGYEEGEALARTNSVEMTDECRGALKSQESPSFKQVESMIAGVSR